MALLELLEQFEHPVPILKIELDAIALDITATTAAGSFVIKNSGGGILSGTVMSNSSYLIFDETDFNGNHVNMRYCVQINGHSVGDEIRTGIVVMSNGGEKKLPVVIKMRPPSVITDDGMCIASLADFAAYAGESASKASALLISPPFAAWLERFGYAQMDIFAAIRKDANAFRALENFLVLSGLKPAVTLRYDGPPPYYEIMPNVSERLSGRIQVQPSGRGYVDAAVTTDGAAWLEVSPKRLTNANFNTWGFADIFYNINTGLIRDKSTKAAIVIAGGDVIVPIKVRKKKPLAFALSKPVYCFGESGTIICENNVGKAVSLRIETDKFIKLETNLKLKQTQLKDKMEIPFTIRLSTLQTTQMTLKKQQSLIGSITIRAAYGNTVVEETLRVAVGESLAKARL